VVFKGAIQKGKSRPKISSTARRPSVHDGIINATDNLKNDQPEDDNKKI
jgi:hypothetical protein